MMLIFHPDKIQGRMTNLLPSDRDKLTEYATRLLGLKQFLTCDLIFALYTRALKTCHAPITLWQPNWPKRKQLLNRPVEPDMNFDVDQSWMEFFATKGIRVRVPVKGSANPSPRD